MSDPSDRNSLSPPPATPHTHAAGFLRVLGAVFSSFLGIRRKASGERDLVNITPVHVIIAGVLGAAIFVAILVTLVTMITHR